MKIVNENKKNKSTQTPEQPPKRKPYLSKLDRLVCTRDMKRLESDLERDNDV